MPDVFLRNLLSYKRKADEKISLFFAGEIKKARENREDLKIMKEYALRGGKRIRGYLFCFGYRLFNKKLPPEIIDFSIGHELGHAGLLIQDDIFDRSMRRRHQMALHLCLGSKNDLSKFDRFNRKAIFLSDLLICYGYKVFLSSKVESQKKIEALAYLNKQAVNTAAGEFLDLAYTNKNVSNRDVRRMAFLKTASYTTLAPMVMGAIIGGASKKETREVEKIAVKTGELFQMRDDFLDVFGKKEELGKEVASDKKELKRTFANNREDSNKKRNRHNLEKKLLVKKEKIFKEFLKNDFYLSLEFERLLNYLVDRKE